LYLYVIISLFPSSINRMKKKAQQPAAIGVDRGGTWTRVAALNARARPLRQARFKTSPLRGLPEKLTRLLARWPGAKEAPLVIATRGAFSRAWKKPFLIKALRGKLNLAAVISDAEAAHFAAFRGRDGMLLIAGTGAVAFTGRSGAFRQTGGANPPSGDPGSGRWLGRQYLKLRGRLREAGGMGHGRSAAYARRLLRLALGGHGPAAALVAQAQEELAALIKEAAGKGRAPVKVALAGGLLKDPYFRTGFMRAARSALAGRKLSFITAAIPAEQAAALLALGQRGTK
jgi:N-acetylglucosamine kinase-like BadF-type ATPase